MLVKVGYSEIVARVKPGETRKEDYKVYIFTL